MTKLIAAIAILLAAVVGIAASASAATWSQGTLCRKADQGKTVKCEPIQFA